MNGEIVCTNKGLQVKAIKKKSFEIWNYLSQRTDINYDPTRITDTYLVYRKTKTAGHDS